MRVVVRQGFYCTVAAAAAVAVAAAAATTIERESYCCRLFESRLSPKSK